MILKSVWIQNFVLFLTVLNDVRTGLSLDQKCPPLRIMNGRTRYRWRGKSIRFNCMRGFQLVGVKYVTCMNGKWDADTPICVRYGCLAPSSVHVNGQLIESYRGAVVKIVCNAGYTLVGSPSVYCNGIRWNETFPVCVVKNSSPALFCDFEDPNLCGWSQDPMHDFDWKREKASPFKINSLRPRYDHTLGENKSGHYMYIESSNPKMENDTARLFSPVYPAAYSNGSCFKFWYYKAGSPTGYLKVFVKPEEMELHSIIPNLWLTGSEEDSWIEGFFPIEPTTSRFQIVIEGIRGSVNVSDAFDDVRIAFGDDECAVVTESIKSSAETSTSVTVTLDDEDPDYYSCKNKCISAEASYVNVSTNNLEVADEARCSCQAGCVRDVTCCPDYFDLCYAAVTTAVSLSTRAERETQTQSEKTSAAKPVPVDNNNESNEINPVRPILQQPPKISVKETPKENTTLNNMTNRIDEKVPETDFEKLLFPKNVTEVGTAGVTRPNITNVDFGYKNKSGPEFTSEGFENKTEIPRVPESKSEENSTTALNENPVAVSKNVSSDRKTVTGTKTWKKLESDAVEVPQNSPTTSSTYDRTPTRSFRISPPKIMKATLLEKPSSPTLSNEFRFRKGKPKETAGKEPPQAIKIDKNKETSNGRLKRILEVTGPCLAGLVVIVLAVAWYRRTRNRKSERENMVEDSDVRYLTSDEVLDFTLARPADDDL